MCGCPGCVSLQKQMMKCSRNGKHLLAEQNDSDQNLVLLKVFSIVALLCLKLYFTGLQHDQQTFTVQPKKVATRHLTVTRMCSSSLITHTHVDSCMWNAAFSTVGKHAGVRVADPPNTERSVFVPTETAVSGAKFVYTKMWALHGK